jgi:hypothetical protein
MQKAGKRGAVFPSLASFLHQRAEGQESLGVASTAISRPNSMSFLTFQSLMQKAGALRAGGAGLRGVS